MIMSNKDAAEWQKQLDKLQMSTLNELFLKHKCLKGIDLNMMKFMKLTLKN